MSLCFLAILIIGVPCFLVSEKKLFSELMNMLDMQVHEMKSMSRSIRKLEGTNSHGCFILPGMYIYYILVSASITLVLEHCYEV